MRSSSILVLGILFTILLITYCVTQFINKNHPNIKNISAPIIDISRGSNKQKNQTSYQEIIQNIKNEEKELQNIYKQNIEQEKRINMQIKSIHLGIKRQSRWVYLFLVNSLTQIKTNYKGS